MLMLLDPGHVEQIGDPDIRALAAQRFRELAAEEPYDPDVHGPFAVVEAGDTLETIEAATGCWLKTSLFDENVQYGDEGYMPAFEFLEEHPACFEVCFIFSDGGYGTLLFVSKSDAMDPTVMRYCREFAEPAYQGDTTSGGSHAAST